MWWVSSQGNVADNPEETSGQSSRTGASGPPGDSENKTSGQRKGVVPWDRCTGRKEDEELHCLSSQHTPAEIVHGTSEHVKATGWTLAKDRL